MGEIVQGSCSVTVIIIFLDVNINYLQLHSDA